MMGSDHIITRSELVQQILVRANSHSKSKASVHIYTYLIHKMASHYHHNLFTDLFYIVHNSKARIRPISEGSPFLQRSHGD